MASQQGSGAPGGSAAHTAGSPQQLNQIVMEYLSKKGYSKTEAMLRVESARTDADGRPIIKPDEYPEVMYEKAYCEFSPRSQRNRLRKLADEFFSLGFSTSPEMD
jgi:transcription initiation factor TFIID subunit 5